MSNKSFSENELIIEERTHSYVFYKGKITELLEECDKPNNQNNQGSHSILYSFSDVVKRAKEACKPDSDDIIYSYNSYRIMLFKNLNLLNAFTEKVCHNNIDSSFLSGGLNIQTASNAFIWFMCDAYNFSDQDAQDMNRIRAVRKLRYELDCFQSKSFFDNQSLEEFHKTDERKSVTEKEFDLFKKDLKELLNHTFRVYECLAKYCSYLPDFFVSDGQAFESTDCDSVREAYILSEATKKVFLEILCGFSKIPQMNLGNSNLDFACFTRSNLSGSNFINSTFIRTQLDNSFLSDCDFSICDFTRANAKEATMNNCIFNYSDMRGLNLTNASLNDSNFDTVLFRDDRIDNNIPFVKRIIELMKNDDDRAAVMQLIENLEHPIADLDLDAVLFALYERLGKSKSTNADTLWGYTVVDSDSEVQEDDYKSRIGRYNTDTEERDPSATLFDEVFNRVCSELKRVKSFCERKVLGGKLLDYMYKAEAEQDNYQYVKKVEEDFGDICLERTVLSGATIKNSSLHQIDISNIDFQNACFEGSDLSECVVYYSEGKTASFAAATLGLGEFFECNLDDTGFANANCIGSKFINCSMNNVNMDGVIAIGAKFVNTEHTEPFIKSLLKRLNEIEEDIDDTVEFSNESINLIESSWNNANLSKAIFVGYLMDRSHFNTTDIRSSLFFDCVMRWSVFNECDASYALLLGNCFHQASFINANLSQSHIFASEFSSCQMTGANFIGARCDRVIFIDVDFTDANFSHCWFQNCIFKDCIFTSTNMSRVNFNRCIFINTSFEDCKGMLVNSTVFTNCLFPDNHSREKEDNRRNIAAGRGIIRTQSLDTITIKKASEADGSEPFKLEWTTKEIALGRDGTLYDLYSTNWQ